MSGTAVLVEEGPDTGLLWHRGSPFAEQKAFEQGAAIIELARGGIIEVSGPDRLEWLNSLSTGRFGELQPGQGLEALLLSPTGHVQHLLRAVEDGERLWLSSDAHDATAVFDYLASMRFRTKVQVVAHPELSLRWVGAQLTGERGLPEPVAPAVPAPFGPGTLQIGAVGQPGPDDERMAGMWAWHAERIAAGVPKIGVDTDERTLPNELGLYATALDKGCYCGQETVARVHNLGRPPRRLVRLLLDGSTSEIPGIGSAIGYEGHDVGRIGATAIHHEDGPIALGLVTRSIPVDAQFAIAGVPAAQEALVDPDIGLHVKPAHLLRRR
ncbi:hypothetical protein SAMN05443377_10922 [Propionibacterium cyclohexanicum]|uniref:Uncharacterized protein n=1 Tax=Propionibacterium cyclohexanicum TaxID=64702 RepID=A0A1H9RSY1_9ACTN|nr:folate-binding protein YgfZ [Propionibacterium cyclohexanicum]SER75902.1 hypothetical protein SAMN05443377_10922 [Propionibacterium cyclohexanicum]